VVVFVPGTGVVFTQQHATMYRKQDAFLPEQTDCGAESSARAGEIPQAAWVRPRRALENLRFSFGRIPSGFGAALAHGRREDHVFRGALFLIVVTLAVGQSAGRLCKVWCHDATSTGCPHQDSTTSSSVRDDSCTVVAGAVAFVSEDGRRTVPAPDAQNALVVRRFRFVAPSTDPRSGLESERRLLLEERPLIIALRM